MLLLGIPLLVGSAFLFWHYATGLWRNASPMHPDRVAPWWPYGAISWRALLRVNTLASAMMLALAITAIVLSIEGKTAQAVGGGLSLFTIALLVPCLSVVFFNRPRFLVPPHLRHQPGAFAEWRGKPVRPTPDGPRSQAPRPRTRRF
jgi:hypothetical protein